MKKILYIIVSILIWVYVSSGAYASTEVCSIQSGPPPLFAAYIKNAKQQAQSIDTRYSGNLCSSGNSPMNAYKKTLSTLNKSSNQLPLMNNLITDFTYNVTTLYRLDMPPVVLTHGQLLYRLEIQTLIPTLERLASRCQLGGDAEREMIELISYNNTIQDYFRWVVNGTAPKAADDLQEEIQKEYDESNTMKCTDDTSTAIEKLSDTVGGFGSDITIAMENWREAKALLSWESTWGKENYAALQTKLLQTELSRQWLSQTAMTQIMNNLACAQAQTDGTMSIEDQARAKEKCKRVYVFWYDKLKADFIEVLWGNKDSAKGVFKNTFKKPTNTDEFLLLQAKIDTHTQIDTTINALYGELQAISISEADDEVITNKIITDLVNTHSSLVGVNRLIEKRIPMIQADCMKWNPWVTGACYAQ